MLPSLLLNINKNVLISKCSSRCVIYNLLFGLDSLKPGHPYLAIKKRATSNFTYSNVHCSHLYSTKNHVVSNRFSQTSRFKYDLESSRRSEDETSTNLGDSYLENLFNTSPKEWIYFLRNADRKNEVLSLLTNFQRYIRHLKSRELLEVMENCSKLEIRDNNERIDVHYVLICELAHRLLHENNRIMSLNDISRLCRVLVKMKFNKEAEQLPTVPICSKNFEYSKNPLTCDNCRTRYGELLGLTGNDLSTTLMVLLGKSIVDQSRDLKTRHENSVIPYLVLVGNRNCTLCSHLVRDITSVYLRQFLSNNSIHNISILLHTLKRTKARVYPLARKIVLRLCKDGEVESLLRRERTLKGQLVSISQIIQFIINTHYSPSAFNRELDNLALRLVKFVKKLFESGSLDLEKIREFPNFVSQMNLLSKSAAVERFHLSKELQESKLSLFLSVLEELKPEFSQNDYRTSNTHVQVDSVLKSFNYETRLEQYLTPYVVDILIPSRNCIIEVDGPYHYTTSINERINKILKRNVDRYEPRYTLNSVLKRRLLTKSGFNFVNIPFYRWPQSINEQVYFVSNLKL